MSLHYFIEDYSLTFIGEPADYLKPEYKNNWLYDATQYPQIFIELTSTTQILVLVYVFSVQYVPEILKYYNIPAWRPVWLIATWNFILALFSIIGTFAAVPRFGLLKEQGFYEFSCTCNGHWFNLEGTLGLFFGISKYFELMDTFWLIVGQRRVSFLHWYHHATVLLFTWNVMITLPIIAVWYCIMNYIVHGIMYTYYFFSQIKNVIPVYQYIYPYRMLITILQILQMIIGFAVTFYAYYQGEENCPGNNQNTVKYGLIIYSTYFALFIDYFIKIIYSKKTITFTSKKTV